MFSQPFHCKSGIDRTGAIWGPPGLTCARLVGASRFNTNKMYPYIDTFTGTGMAPTQTKVIPRVYQSECAHSRRSVGEAEAATSSGHTRANVPAARSSELGPRRPPSHRHLLNTCRLFTPNPNSLEPRRA